MKKRNYSKKKGLINYLKKEANKDKEKNKKKETEKITFECGATIFKVDKKYKFIKQMGIGAYGVVASCLDTEKNVKVAIKKVYNAFEDLVDAKRIYREIKILKFMNHNNIIGLKEIVKPEKKTKYKDIYIITELMETDLHRVIYSKQNLTDEHIQYFIYQIIRGVLFMHSANIMHRDLKPSNILLNKKCDLKICDFGLGRSYLRNNDYPFTDYVVTRWYRAPEIILDASEYTKAVDIWSIGCILAELLGRATIFPGENYLDQIQRIISILGTPSYEDLNYITNEEALKFIKSMPKRTKQKWIELYPDSNPLALDLLEKMLSFNPKQRFTIEQCISHPYFTDLHDPDDEPLSEVEFDWSFDNIELTEENLQKLIYKESLSFDKNRKN